MKKTAIIFFISTYLILTAGLTLEIHFCGDEITSVQVIHISSKGNSCGCEDTGGPDNCCKTENRSFQLSNEQIAAHSVQPAGQQSDINIFLDVSAVRTFSQSITHNITPTSSPPDSPSIYILHRSLLI